MAGALMKERTEYLLCLAVAGVMFAVLLLALSVWG